MRRRRRAPACSSCPPKRHAFFLLDVQSYAGDVANNVRHGLGSYVYANSYFRYEGEWVNGKKHGAPHAGSAASRGDHAMRMRKERGAPVP